MSITTEPPRPALAPWAVATVLGYLRDEAEAHAQVARRLRSLGDVDRQEQIITAIRAVERLAAAELAECDAAGPAGDGERDFARYAA
jgi:hypothetical protein